MLAIAVERKPETGAGPRPGNFLAHCIQVARAELGAAADTTDVVDRARQLVRAHMIRAGRRPRSSRRLALQRAAAQRAQQQTHPIIDKVDATHQNDETSGPPIPLVSKGATGHGTTRRST